MPRPPTDLARYDRAVEWFRARVPMTRSSLYGAREMVRAECLPAAGNRPEKN